MRSLAPSSAKSILPPKPGTFLFSHSTNSEPEKQSEYSPISGKRTGLRGSSTAARVSRLDTADGDRDRPAKRIGAAGSGTVDEADVGEATSAFEGGKGGDMGGGDDARTGEGGSTALPLPLSTFGDSSSLSSLSSCTASDVAVDAVDATALR